MPARNIDVAADGSHRKIRGLPRRTAKVMPVGSEPTQRQTRDVSVETKVEFLSTVPR